MNAGYISVIVMIMVWILLATGWKKQLLGIADFPHQAKIIPLFFMAWFFGVFVIWQPVKWLQISGALIVVWFIAVSLFIASRHVLHFLQIASTSSLIAALDVFWQQWIQLNPKHVWHTPVVDISLVIVLFTAWLIRSFSGQLTSITIGLTGGHLCYYFLHDLTPPLYLGSMRFFDQWWLILFIARLVSALIRIVFRQKAI